MIIGIMLVILLLFFNKMTTPRYLSDIELKINGLQLLKNRPSIADEKSRWRLVSANSQQQQVLLDLLPLLKNSIQRKTELVTLSELSMSSLNGLYPTQEAIAIINPQGQLVGYIKAPFDQQRMILTYSSLVTHR